MRKRDNIGAAGMLVAFCVILAEPVLGENVDPDQDGSQYAYGENAGWINAEPLGEGGPGMQVDDFVLTGWLWGENIGWISLSCENTASCAATDYGVTNNADGALAGFAWSENAGWISFSCSNTKSCGATPYGVVIDPLSGELSGRAWSENLGWISFASDGPHPYRIRTDWLCSTPTGSPEILLGGSGSATQLSWTGIPGWVSYDVVRGDLMQLRASGGDFAAATNTCLADDIAGTSLFDGDTPDAGQSFWFLVRAANCGGGSYDSGGAAQAAPRDAAIDVSVGACP